MDFYYYSCLSEEILDMKKPQDLSDLGRPCGYLVFKLLNSAFNLVKPGHSLLNLVAYSIFKKQF